MTSPMSSQRHAPRHAAAAPVPMSPLPPPPPLALSCYTDAAAMTPLLQAQLPGYGEGGLRILQLRVLSARRNTSRRHNPCPLTLCYELQVAQGERQGCQWLYAEVHRQPETAVAAWQAGQHGLVAPPFGQALVHLPALALLLWALPNDPGLPQLATLLDPQQAARHVPDAPAHGLQVELLRYEPRCRATLRYHWPSDDGSVQVRFAKTFRDDRAALIDSRFQHFWQNAQARPEAPLVARPLGFDAALRTVWQAPAAGVPLDSWLAGPAADDAGMAAVARAWAALHAAPLADTVSARPRTVDHWLTEVRRRCKKIARAVPDRAGQVAAIEQGIEAAAGHQARRPLSLIHGDCHPGQVWLQAGRVVLFDFDEFTLGDPMEDLAEFVLKLEQSSLAPTRVAPFLAPFLAHYAAVAPERFDAASLAWHLAVQSLLQASRAFVYQAPGWLEQMDERLQVCTAQVARLQVSAAAAAPGCAPVAAPLQTPLQAPLQTPLQTPMQTPAGATRRPAP